jgi:molybdopterin-containing oxidoreductase family iron-sulfur binding subunit
MWRSSTGLSYSGGNAAQAVAELSAFKPAQLELHFIQNLYW